jgi:hypothetical protein
MTEPHCAIIHPQQFRSIEVRPVFPMRYAICAAAAVFTLTCTVPVRAQTSDPAAANRALIGEGPKVNVQQSAIGTLDVGGPGAANPKLTGENLRGNLGASRAQPDAGITPAAPHAGVPNYSFQTPNFGPDLGGPAPARKPTKQDLRVAEDLILPRFRSGRGEQNQLAPLTHDADGWRYRHFNGRWWYWKPNESWAYWDGARWANLAARQ